jgi:UMF1 family MFS transporter
MSSRRNNSVDLTMNTTLEHNVKPHEVWAWAMYDFANSGYTTVVITAIFNAYFVSVIAGNAPWATFAWTLSLAVSYALIMYIAPLIGAYADAYAAKKKLLLITTAGCVTFTSLLYFAGAGNLWLAIPLIILSNFFYGSGENLIAAFLPELASGKALGRVSGWGWSLGYIGGLTSLGTCLVYITWAQGHGLHAEEFVPVTMLIVAFLFALSSLPTFIFLKERAIAQPHLQGMNTLQESFARLRETLHHAEDFRDLRRFLICTVFYQAGIQAVITLAAIYAQQAMHFSTQQTIMLIFVVNITAAIGAFLFGHVQDRIGHIPAIAITLIGWIIMVLLAFAAQGPDMFWLAANLAGLCMGASQSAGRALVGLLSPVARRAEFFGLWGMAVKLSSILGPVTYGIVSWVTAGDHRLAILITGSYFVVGLFVLFGVNIKRGTQAALHQSAPAAEILN